MHFNAAHAGTEKEFGSEWLNEQDDRAPSGGIAAAAGDGRDDTRGSRKRGARGRRQKKSNRRDRYALYGRTRKSRCGEDRAVLAPARECRGFRRGRRARTTTGRERRFDLLAPVGFDT